VLRSLLQTWPAGKAVRLLSLRVKGTAASYPARFAQAWLRIGSRFVGALARVRFCLRSCVSNKLTALIGEKKGIPFSSFPPLSRARTAQRLVAGRWSPMRR
jgi:hypothetical protein